MRAALGALLVFLVAACIECWPALQSGVVVAPVSHFVRAGPFTDDVRAQPLRGYDSLGDNSRMFTPWLQYAAEHFVKDGRLPLWKDSASCGAPLVGNGQSALFVPTRLLAVLLGAPPWVHLAEVVTKLLLGALGAYLLARHLGLSWLAGVVCGLSFGFGGFEKIWLVHTHSYASALLPLLILAIDRIAQRPTAAAVAGLGLVAGLQHLAGHPETPLHCQSVAFGLGLLRVAACARPHLLKRGALIAAGLLLGVAVGAIQTLPLLEYLRESDSLQLRDAGRALAMSLEPLASAAFIVVLIGGAVALTRLARADRPRAAAVALFLCAVASACIGLRAGMLTTFVAPLAAEWFGSLHEHFGPTNYAEQNGACAGAALALAAAGLLFGQPRGPVKVAGVVLVLGLAASAQAPVIHDLITLLPGFALVSNTRVSLLALLATALLAGWGLDALGRAARREGDGRRLLLAAALPALGAVLGLSLALRQDWITRSPELFAPGAGPARPPAGLIEGPAASGSQAPLAGWFETREPPASVRLVFRGGAVLEDVAFTPTPMPEGEREAGRGRLPPFRRYAFHSSYPDKRLPDGPQLLRVGIVSPSGDTEYSAALAPAPDVLGRAGFVFPVRPATRWAWAQLFLLGLTLIVAVALVRAEGATLRAGRGALTVLIAVSLGLVAREMPPTIPASLFYPPSPLLDHLAREPAQARFVNMVTHRLPSEIPTFYGLRDVLGYDALNPARIARLLREATGSRKGRDPLNRLPSRDDPNAELLGLLAVRLITEADRLAWPAPTVHYPGELAAPENRPFRLAENPAYLPRARLVDAAVFEPDDGRALARLLKPGFPRERCVVLTDGGERAGQGPVLPDVGPAGQAGPAAHAGSAGSAEFVLDEPDRVTIAVAPNRAGWLVLADTWFPGWSAAVDGRPVELLRANVALRAVAVQPGDRLVEFRYEPATFRVGSLVTGAALLAIVGLLVAGRWTATRP